MICYSFVWFASLIVATPYFFAVSAEPVTMFDPWNSAHADQMVQLLIKINIKFKFVLIFIAINLLSKKARNLLRENMAPLTVFASNIYTYRTCYTIYFTVMGAWICLFTNWFNNSKTGFFIIIICSSFRYFFL